MPMIKAQNPNIPSFVRWVDEDIIDDAYARITAKVPEDKFCSAAAEIDFSGFNYDDYRDLQTAMDRIGLNDNMYKCRDFYDNQRIIQEHIQQFLFNCMRDSSSSDGDILKCFEYFVKVTKYKSWISFPYNCLLTRTINKGYSEMSMLKGAVILKHYFGNLSFDADHLWKYHLILTQTPYWKFGHENDDPNWDKDVESFNNANRARKAEISAQDTFIDLVLRDKDYESAYEFIKARDDKED